MQYLVLGSLLLVAWVNAEADVCSLPKKTGPCRAAISRFFFNKKSGQCERFIYGGCDGNGNNFVRKSDCDSKCAGKDEPDVCSMPAETGFCKGAFPRYYFNDKTSKCEHFIFGGCGGNGNNFRTEDECLSQCGQKTDACMQPKQPGMCRAYIPRFFFNSESGKCEQFIYGGCGANDNNFDSEDKCEERCVPTKDDDVCSRPKKVGPCKAAYRRFYFDEKSGKCKRFTYGGCQGNGNNFESAEQCAALCARKEKRETDVCSQPKKPGMCRAYMPRFYFNSKSGKCEQFVYGGCGANDNNFMTVDECNKQCGGGVQKREQDVCSLPSDTGPCRAAMPRFFFNKKSGKCERFIYGGCQGNENNFQTQEECEGKCSPRTKRSNAVQRCRQPAVTGPCDAYFPRYFFNHNTGLCEKFVYGGCQGNDNNFKTVHECENSCLMKKRGANICDLPAETGPCRAAFPRFFFNGKSGKCERFIYGGCQGNENNFETQEACEGKCAPKAKRSNAVQRCRQPAESGPCYAYIPRFFFNHKTGTCEKFVFGGCQGNENNFKSIRECENSCLMKKREVDTCDLPAETGPCKALMRRFHYNKHSGECEQFVYGGCRGNSNNFKTVQECEQSCKTN